MNKTKEELELDLIVAEASKAELETRQSGEMSNATNAIARATTVKTLLIARHNVQLANANKKISEIESKISDIAE